LQRLPQFEPTCPSHTQVTTNLGKAQNRPHAGSNAEVLEKYHTRLVAPFCLSAVKSFFDGFQRSR
jgi:hypothetical protein